MKPKSITWKDVEQRRNILLAQTNWTQSPNNGLTEESLKRWKKWRDQLTSVNKNNYSLDEADKRLNNLKKKSPSYEYQYEVKDFFHGSNSEIYDLPDIIKTIKELIAKELSKNDENLLLDDFNDLDEAKKYVRRELDKACREQIKKASPAPETMQLYTERLNQAIDYLAGTGSSFPLLQVLVDNTTKDMKEVASKLLKSHTNMIRTYVEIEDKYFKTLKAVKESDRIDQLREISEKFINGH